MKRLVSKEGSIPRAWVGRGLEGMDFNPAQLANIGMHCKKRAARVTLLTLESFGLRDRSDAER